MNETSGRRAQRQARAVAVGFVVFHAACLLVFYVGVSTAAVVVAVATYLIRGLGITAGFHRYFAHHGFETSRPFQFLLALAGSLAVQGGPMWWVAHHRAHHRFTETERDQHSPRIYGLWHAHMGWMLDPKCFGASGAHAKDMHRYPELKALQRLYVPLILAQMALLYALGAGLNALWPELGTSGLQMLVWGFFISTVLLWHATFMVNSVCHRWGSQPHDTGDDSTNNPFVALVALGEGWHNNHHRYAVSARHGLEWWQFDLTWVVLRILEKLRIVRGLKLPRQPTEQQAA